MGDETYLESFIEQLSTLPSEIKRNLELMKDLDKKCSWVSFAAVCCSFLIADKQIFRATAEQLRQLQHEYVARAEGKVMQLELGKTADGRDGVKVLGGSGEVIVPTTEELKELIRDTEAFQQIQILEGNALQQAEEKVAIADQTYRLVNGTCARLNKDLATLETWVNEDTSIELCHAIFLTSICIHVHVVSFSLLKVSEQIYLCQNSTHCSNFNTLLRQQGGSKRQAAQSLMTLLLSKLFRIHPTGSWLRLLHITQRLECSN